MFFEPVNRAAFCALLAYFICGGAIVFAQEKSSLFYSNYDARELVKNGKYKGIDFAYGEGSNEFTVEEQSGAVEKSKSISYGCRIQTTGDGAFNVADFLSWLLEQTTKQIESGKGTVVRTRHKVGRRFYIEYTQNGFTGRVEIDADLTGKDQMSLDVEIIESSKK